MVCNVVLKYDKGQFDGIIQLRKNSKIMSIF